MIDYYSNEDILFAELNLPSLNKKIAAEEILSVEKHFWFWDPYRGTKMLPLMTKGAQESIEGTSNYRGGDFEWTEYTPQIIKDWFEYIVFPWMGTKTRIMALMTMPGISNKEHVDCTESEIGSIQHKFRIVLQGRTDTLYFKTFKGNIVVPNVKGAFIMDGGWPHGMQNTDNIIKVTLAAGAPWNGNQHYDMLQNVILKKNYTLPSNVNLYLKTGISKY
jgi:hypothetical protein